MLLEMGQSHLFEHWAEPGVDDEEKKRFFEQVRVFYFLRSVEPDRDFCFFLFYRVC